MLFIQEFVQGISLRDYYNKEIRNQKGISVYKSKTFKKIFKKYLKWWIIYTKIAWLIEV